MANPNVLVYLQDFFERTALSQPDLIALDDSGATVTYGDLEVRANRIGHYLKAAGCKPNDRVCIFLGKNETAYAAVLGSLKSGACWVPLSDQHPNHRLEHILSSTEPKVVICESATLNRLEGLKEDLDLNFDILELDGKEKSLANQPEVAPSRSGHSPDDLAYIIFTSGSTGEPKGVMVKHSNISLFLSLCYDLFPVEAGLRFAHHSELTFDPSLFDLFYCWGTGGTLVPFNKRSYRINPGKFVRENKINVWFSVPSALATIAQAGQVGDSDLACLKHILLTGEITPPNLARQWMDAYPKTKIYNVYGTTETAIISHFYALPKDIDSTQPIPIGNVLPGMRVMLMDGDVQVKNGEIGESVVTGTQVSPGYWRNVAENAARFVPNPLDPTLPQGVYRTGDLLMKRPDGLYEYKGRIDSQVKVRGHRVELNEVESAILPFPGIDETAVLLNKDEERPEEAHLVGFLAAPENVNEDLLTAYLRERIPSYMVPSRFINKPSGLPKNSNQKIDKLALKAEMKAK